MWKVVLRMYDPKLVKENRLQIQHEEVMQVLDKQITG